MRERKIAGMLEAGKVGFQSNADAPPTLLALALFSRDGKTALFQAQIIINHRKRAARNGYADTCFRGLDLVWLEIDVY